MTHGFGGVWTGQGRGCVPLSCMCLSAAAAAKFNPLTMKLSCDPSFTGYQSSSSSSSSSIFLSCCCASVCPSWPLLGLVWHGAWVRLQKICHCLGQWSSSPVVVVVEEEHTASCEHIFHPSTHPSIHWGSGWFYQRFSSNGCMHILLLSSWKHFGGVQLSLWGISTSPTAKIWTQPTVSLLGYFILK